LALLRLAARATRHPRANAAARTTDAWTGSCTRSPDPSAITYDSAQGFLRRRTTINDNTAIAREGRLRAMLQWLGRRERGMLVALIVVLGGGWFFAELSDEVVEGETRRIDERVLLLFRTADGDPIGPGWIEETARDFTALGGIGILTLVTL